MLLLALIGALAPGCREAPVPGENIVRTDPRATVPSTVRSAKPPPGGSSTSTAPLASTARTPHQREPAAPSSGTRLRALMATSSSAALEE